MRILRGCQEQVVEHWTTCRRVPAILETFVGSRVARAFALVLVLALVAALRCLGVSVCY